MKKIKVPLDMNTGTTHKTKFCGDIEIVDYIGAHNVLVKFKKTSTLKKCGAKQIRDGKVKDHMHPSVCGIGFIGIGDYTPSKNKDSYSIWQGLFSRCYSSRLTAYEGCQVDKDWHCYQNFAKWYNKNTPKDGGKHEVDKDMLIIGNKTYSPESCLLMPHWLNSFVLACNSKRGEQKIGVCFDKQTGTFRAKCSNNGRTVSLGRFSKSEDAHLAWRKYKLQLALDKKPKMDEIDLRIYPNVIKIIKDAK